VCERERIKEKEIERRGRKREKEGERQRAGVRGREGGRECFCENRRRAERVREST